MKNFAYLLRCADGSLYAGWTNDLDRRLAAHNEGKGAKYTRGRRPVALAWAQAYPTKSEAMAMEARLKRLPKAKKEALPAGWSGLPAAGPENDEEKAGNSYKTKLLHENAK